MLAKGYEDISEKAEVTRNKLNRAIAKQDRDLMIAYGKELVEQLDVEDMYRTAVLREKQKQREEEVAEKATGFTEWWCCICTTTTPQEPNQGQLANKKIS